MNLGPRGNNRTYRGYLGLFRVILVEVISVIVLSKIQFSILFLVHISFLFSAKHFIDVHFYSLIKSYVSYKFHI